MKDLPINQDEWNHLENTFGNLRRYDQRVEEINGSQSKITHNTFFKDTPFKEIRKILEHLSFSKGKKLIDLGMGSGAVCAVGHLLGGDVKGVENDGIMYKIALKAWDDFEKDISRKIDYDPLYLGDALNFPISDADIIWSYLMTEKQPDVLRKYIREAKPRSKIVLRHPSDRCYDLSKNNGLEQLDTGNIIDTLILRK